MQDSINSIDEFVALSEFSRDKHHEFGFPREMRVIPPCGGDAVADGGAESPHPRPYFFVAGRLEAVKGIQTVIPELRHFPDVDLLVAGSGSLDEELKREGGKQLVLLGQLSAAALEKYYRHAIATIVPSVVFETFGLTLAESFRCGTPVIARRIGPFPEIVTRSRGGLLFGDDGELRDSMRKLATDAAYRTQLGSQGRAAFLELWENGVAASSYLSMIEQALDSRQRRVRPV